MMEYASIDLGLIGYKRGYALQKKYLAEVVSNGSKGFILFAEHPPVFTMGRAASDDDMLLDIKSIRARGIEVCETDRGGKVTYHGPGQLIVYPIFNLANHQKDLRWFMRSLEDVVMRTLGIFDIPSFRVDGKTGVWTKKGKISSIGIGVSRWISYHGLAINSDVNLEFFKMINPCGLKDVSMTSIKALTGRRLEPEVLKQALLRSFKEVFAIKNK